MSPRTPERFPTPFPRGVEDHEHPTPRVTPDHHGDLKKLLVGGVMALLSGLAGIIGSHWGGATKDDIVELRKDMATKAVDDAQKISALWAQVGILQAQANTVDPSPPATKQRTKRKRAPELPTGGSGEQ